jgi:hypothetical protein
MRVRLTHSETILSHQPKFQPVRKSLLLKFPKRNNRVPEENLKKGLLNSMEMRGTYLACLNLWTRKSNSYLSKTREHSRALSLKLRGQGIRRKNSDFKIIRKSSNFQNLSRNFSKIRQLELLWVNLTIELLRVSAQKKSLRLIMLDSSILSLFHQSRPRI